MEANGGTLFLDEIGEMTLEVQPKLLRAIQYKEIQRVGGETLHADVRIVAATNRSLEEAIYNGGFRRDLYYRLSGATIRVPTLQERKEDIPLLAEYFLRRYAALLDKRISGFDEAVLPYLMSRAWSGNVRELENMVEMAVLRCTGSLVHLSHFPPELQRKDRSSVDSSSLEGFFGEMAALPLDKATAEFERLLISRVLDETDGNVTHAANRLGMGRTALHRKMKALGVRRDSSPNDD
jgi:two-component system response regulator HydG